jgi:glucose/arabinose dehydrogenase/mono/diheme cytochrome c family protein
MKKRNYCKTCLFLLFFILIFSFCSEKNKPGRNRIEIFPDKNNGGINLPENFGAMVVVDTLGRGRHIVVNDNGDIYVHLRRLNHEGKGIVALRDINHDGRADHIEGYSEVTGTGIELHNGYLYFSSRTQVFRARLNKGELLPSGPIDTLVHMVDGTGHMEKPFTFDGKGNMYVNIGSASNACQEERRTEGSPGVYPCIELETRAGIWKFSDNDLNQQQTLDKRYATGIRNAVALVWNDQVDKLFALQHGRDDLHRFWPDYYSEEDNLELPAEEFLDVEEGDDFGWPYCYYDQFKGQRLKCPEYGGDGESTEGCEGVKEPLIGFPGHWGPNDLLFYTGKMFPEKYRNGAFVAFHGSWNRLGAEQQGYNVVFIPMENGVPSGEWEVFADGFTGGPIESSGDARYRPCGLAQGPDGSLFIVDSQKGRIWRIMYYENGIPGYNEVPVATVAVKKAEEEIDEALLPGKNVYQTYCAACHMMSGKGAPGMNPPLIATDWVVGDKERLIKVILNGLNEPIEIQGEIYQNIMASHAFLTDQQIADVLSFIRNSWGNKASYVTVDEVAEIRANNN